MLRLLLPILLAAAVLQSPTLAQAQQTAAAAATSQGALSDRERAIHLLNRATYGAREQDVEQVMRMGRAAWLDLQLNPARVDDAVADARLAQRSGLEGFAFTDPLVESARRSAEKASTALREQLETVTGNVATARDLIADGTRRLDSARARLSKGPDPSSPGYAELQREIETSLQQLDEAGRQATLARSAMSDAQRQYESTMRLHTGMMALDRAGSAMQSRLRQAPGIGVLTTTKLERAVYSERQLEEVMTDFWFNHFNVYYSKSPEIGWALGDYEQSAIRAHVFGRFEDMLVATAQHAAMMLYLDNATSRAAPPVANGLNENYARELLELHTLGVDAGYTQQDVIEVAKAFTGWGTNGNRDQLVAFQYRPEYHEPGSKRVLGRVIPERGMDEGLEILTSLARHPATARHIATKLVQHFVSDEPRPELVAEIARVFTETDGDLKAVTRALFTSDRFYARENFRAKVKRPFEFMTSALRASRADLELEVQDASLVTRLGIMRHLPYSQPAPTGYSNVSADWVSASAALDRVNFALTLVTGGYDEVRLDLQNSFADAPPLFGIVGFIDPAAVTRLLESVLLVPPSSQLQQAVMQSISRPLNRERPQSLASALALAIGSPDFQRY